MSSLVTLSLSQLIIVSVASFSIEAFDLIFLEYFNDQKPIAINPTNKRPRTTFTSMKLELPFVTNFNIPMSLRIRIIIPAAPHAKKLLQTTSYLYICHLLTHTDCQSAVKAQCLLLPR